MADRDVLLTKGRAAIAEHRFAEAENIVSELAAQSGNQPLANFLTGALAFERKDLQSAEAALEKSLAAEPDLVDALTLQLRIVMQHGGDAAAAASLASSLLGKPDLSAASLNLAAKALARANNVDKAVDIWRRIAESNRSDPAPLASVAAAYLKAKRFDKALEAALIAARRDPAAARPLVIAADAALKLDALPQLADAAIKLSVIDPVSALRYAQPLMEAEHVLAGSQVMIACIAADPGLVTENQKKKLERALITAARAANEAGHLRVATELWLSLLKLDPENNKAASYIGRQLSAMMKSANELMVGGDNKGAAELYAGIVAIDPTKGSSWRKLATAYGREEAYEQEAEAWQQLAMLTADPDAWHRAMRAIRKCAPSEKQLRMFAAARAQLGEDSRLLEKGDSLARKLGKIAMDQQIGTDPVAIPLSVLDAIRSWDPTSSIADRLQGRLRTELLRTMRVKEVKEDAEKTADIAEKLLRIDPENLTALQFLARHYYRIRRFEAANVAYEKLIELDASKEVFWRHVSRCRKALRQPESGADMAERFVVDRAESGAEAFLEEETLV